MKRLRPNYYAAGVENAPPSVSGPGFIYCFNNLLDYNFLC